MARRNETAAMGVAMALVDVFTYLVVLGLFVQFLPRVISESFGLTLITAVLLKVTLEGVLFIKKKMLRHVRNKNLGAARVISFVVLLLLLPASKFFILWLTKLIFVGSVQLGGFWAVTGLVLTLTFVRAAVRGLFDWVFPTVAQVPALPER